MSHMLLLKILNPSIIRRATATVNIETNVMYAVIKSFRSF